MKKRDFSKHHAKSCQRIFLFTIKKQMITIFKKSFCAVFARNRPKAVDFGALTVGFRTKKCAFEKMLSFIQKNKKCDTLHSI